jgi:hypothetical protein
LKEVEKVSSHRRLKLLLSQDGFLEKAVGLQDQAATGPLREYQTDPPHPLLMKVSTNLNLKVDLREQKLMQIFVQNFFVPKLYVQKSVSELSILRSNMCCTCSSKSCLTFSQVSRFNKSDHAHYSKKFN